MSAQVWQTRPVRISGKRIVVTGASRGLGKQLAIALHAKGARVVLVARSADVIEKLAAELGGDAYVCDLADHAAIDPLVAAIADDGPIDGVINNAGLDLTGSLTDLDTDAIAQLFAVNLLAPVLLCRAVIPTMLQQDGGTIVNISSLAGSNVLPGLAPYAASKAGLSHFSAGLRAEVKGTPIKVTLAEIGPIVSDMMDSLRSHAPTRRALERLERLKLAYDLPMDTVVKGIVGALEHDKEHLRMPMRDAAFPMLVEAPRTITRWLLTGVDHRSVNE